VFLGGGGRVVHEGNTENGGNAYQDGFFQHQLDKNGKEGLLNRGTGGEKVHLLRAKCSEVRGCGARQLKREPLKGGGEDVHGETAKNGKKAVSPDFHPAK